MPPNSCLRPCNLAAQAAAGVVEAAITLNKAAQQAAAAGGAGDEAKHADRGEGRVAAERVAAAAGGNAGAAASGGGGAGAGAKQDVKLGTVTEDAAAGERGSGMAGAAAALLIGRLREGHPLTGAPALHGVGSEEGPASLAGASKGLGRLDRDEDVRAGAAAHRARSKPGALPFSAAATGAAFAGEGFGATKASLDSADGALGNGALGSAGANWNTWDGGEAAAASTGAGLAEGWARRRRAFPAGGASLAGDAAENYVPGTTTLAAKAAHDSLPLDLPHGAAAAEERSFVRAGGLAATASTAGSAAQDGLPAAWPEGGLPLGAAGALSESDPLGALAAPAGAKRAGAGMLGSSQGAAGIAAKVFGTGDALVGGSGGAGTAALAVGKGVAARGSMHAADSLAALAVDAANSNPFAKVQRARDPASAVGLGAAALDSVRAVGATSQVTGKTLFPVRTAGAAGAGGAQPRELVGGSLASVRSDAIFKE